MKRFHWSMVCAGFAALATGCGDDEPAAECTPGVDLGCPGAGAAGGAGGSGGGAGGTGTTGTAFCDTNPDAYGCTTEGACFPTDTACFLSNGVGDECMAQRDNSKGTTERIQYRQTWGRSMSPAGLTIDAIYDILRKGSGLTNPGCNDFGTSGFIQLLDTTLSDDGDVTNDTTRSGFAPWVTEAEYGSAKTNGICMIEATYDNAVARLPADQMSPSADYPSGMPAPMPLPWNIAPVTLKRVADDFNVDRDRETLIQNAADDPDADGYFYLNEETGYNHGYVPLTYVVVYTIAPENYTAIPIREVETQYQVNDTTERSCIGSFRGGDLDTAANCDSATPTNPQWGCPGDVDCPAGESAANTKGYFLITELEQVQSATLGQTLCVLYPGTAAATADGFNEPSPDLGANCRLASGWDPANGGLPSGDWCAATNSPATPDCHDAFRNETFMAFQGFNVAETTCGF